MTTSFNIFLPEFNIQIHLPFRSYIDQTDKLRKHNYKQSKRTDKPIKENISLISQSVPQTYSGKFSVGKNRGQFECEQIIFVTVRAPGSGIVEEQHNNNTGLFAARIRNVSLAGKLIISGGWKQGRAQDCKCFLPIGSVVAGVYELRTPYYWFRIHRKDAKPHIDHKQYENKELMRIF